MLDSHIDKHLVLERKVSSAKFNEKIKRLSAEGKFQRSKPVPPPPKTISDAPNISVFTAILLTIACGGILFVTVHNLIRLIQG